MAPVKVIVQGIPIDYDDDDDDGKNAEGCANENKMKLEKLFTTYGPVKCVYLWSDVSAYFIASSPIKRKRFGRGEKELMDNFAQILFKNANDAATACQAAANHEIRFNNSILILTPVLEPSVPIENLDDDCLIKIFSFLDAGQRLEMEEVCKRWQQVAEGSWSDVRKLSLMELDWTDEQFEKGLIRCGRYLKEIDCSYIKLPQSVAPNLILTYCQQIEAMELNIYYYRTCS